MCCILPYDGLVLAQISPFSSSRIIETYYAAAHFSTTHDIRVFIFIFIVKAPSKVPCRWCILRTHAWCDQLRSILSLSTVQLKYKALCTVQSSNKSRRVYIKHSHFFLLIAVVKKSFCQSPHQGFCWKKLTWSRMSVRLVCYAKHFRRTYVLTSSIVSRITQHHKCSDILLFLTYATYFGHNQAILQWCER